MNVQILESGKEDLRDGRLFYERQGGRWLGSCFLDTLFSATFRRCGGNDCCVMAPPSRRPAG